MAGDIADNRTVIDDRKDDIVRVARIAVSYTHLLSSFLWPCADSRSSRGRIPRAYEQRT